MKVTKEEYGNLIRPALYYMRPASVGALRVARRLLERLEDIGAATGPSGPDGFVPMMIPDDAEIAFDEGERGILLEALHQMATQLPVGATKGLVELLDRMRIE